MVRLVGAQEAQHNAPNAAAAARVAGGAAREVVEERHIGGLRHYGAVDSPPYLQQPLRLHGLGEAEGFPVCGFGLAGSFRL